MTSDNYNKSRISQSPCEQTELLIDEHLEGMISIKDKELMDEHLEKCDACKSYLKDTTELVNKINSIPADPVNLSVQNKNDMWTKIESGINQDKYKTQNSLNTDNSDSGSTKVDNFLYKYKYVLSGVAAVLLIFVIFYGVKNMNLGNTRLAQQSAFGLGSYWKVSSLQGSPQIGDVAMTGNDSIKEGQWIQTNFDSRAELMVAGLGKVIIEPNSKVVLLKNSEGNNRIMVEYGTVNTEMKPNARSFFVEMPSAVATDNGGSYTLTIDSTGDGLIYVRSGKVEVESQNKDAIVPAGSIVLTRKNKGVGTPFNEKSSPKFKNALINFDFGQCTGSCVSTLINTARISDAVSLVNLIPNVEKEYSDKVYTKLATFVQPPRKVHHDSIMFMNEEELNQWIDKIQTEVQVNVEKSMKEVEKSLEQLENIEYFDPESIKGLEDFAKNWKFQIKTSPEGTYNWEMDSVDFDKEQFEEDMKQLKHEIKMNNQINKEELEEDMKELKEELKEMQIELKENLNLNNEELKKELEKANEEIRKALKEVDKIQIPDSLHHKIKVKVNTDKDIEFNNEIEAPEPPEIPVGEDD